MGHSSQNSNRSRRKARNNLSFSISLFCIIFLCLNGQSGVRVGYIFTDQGCGTMDHIRKAFDEIATGYDAQREYVIPEMRQFYGALVWAAESPSVSPAILDVGAGTGLLSALLLEKYPGPRSPCWISLRRCSRLPGNGSATARQSGSVPAIIPGWISAAPTISSAPPSRFTISNRKTSAGYLPGSFQFLNPAGSLRMPIRPKGRRRTSAKNTVNTGTTFYRAGRWVHRRHAEIRRRRDILDRNEKLSVQLAWLHEAGFSEVDVVYKNRNFMVTVARKGRDFV